MDTNLYLESCFDGALLLNLLRTERVLSPVTSKSLQSELVRETVENPQTMRIPYSETIRRLMRRAVLELADHTPRCVQLDQSVLQKWGNDLHIDEEIEFRVIWGGNEGHPYSTTLQTIEKTMQDIHFFLLISYEIGSNPLPSLRKQFPRFTWSDKSPYRIHVGTRRWDLNGKVVVASNEYGVEIYTCSQGTAQATDFFNLTRGDLIVTKE